MSFMRRMREKRSLEMFAPEAVAKIKKWRKIAIYEFLIIVVLVVLLTGLAL